MQVTVMTRIKSGWGKLRDLVPMLASKGLPLEGKGSLYSACVCSFRLYGSKT